MPVTAINSNFKIGLFFPGLDLVFEPICQSYGTLGGLINKQDTQEIIRDQLGNILVTEVDNQMSLASVAGKDPQDWKLNIFLERQNPWCLIEDGTPIVNISIHRSDVDMSASDPILQQRYDGIYNIDCYGIGTSEVDGQGGHIPGDKEAAYEAQRAARLVRNIIMAGPNTSLQLKDPVTGCNIIALSMIESIAYLDIPVENQSVEQVKAARLQLKVSYSETALQQTGEDLEQIFVEVFKKDDGSLYADQLFDFN